MTYEVGIAPRLGARRRLLGFAVGRRFALAKGEGLEAAGVGDLAQEDGREHGQVTLLEAFDDARHQAG